MRANTKDLLANLRLESLEQRLLLSTVPPTVTGVEVSSSSWGQPFLDYLQTSGLGDHGYAIPVGSSSQSTNLPWSNLDQVSITFSEDVHVQASDLSLSGATNTDYQFSHFFYDPVEKVATWTLDAPLAAQERVLIDLDGDGSNPVEDLDGNILDGEWTDEVSNFESGNGTAGGDFEFRFNVLDADAYATGNVDYIDYIYIRYAVGQDTTDPGYNLRYDLDGSGTIKDSDWQHAITQLWTTLPAGAPSGVGNDAPTTNGFDLLKITDRNADTIISLDAVFDDYEDPDSALTYSISSQTNGGLFDSVSINPASGDLSLNAAASGSGRSTITIAATDSGGLTVESSLTVDVDRINQPPVISDYFVGPIGGFVWEFSGTVTDADDDVEGFVVELTGLFDQRVAVRDDGSFYFQRIILPGESDWEIVTTVDPHGEISNSPFAWAGI